MTGGEASSLCLPYPNPQRKKLCTNRTGSSIYCVWSKKKSSIFVWTKRSRSITDHQPLLATELRPIGLKGIHSICVQRENLKGIALGAPWYLCNESYCPHMCMVAQNGWRNWESSEIMRGLPERKKFSTNCSCNTVEVADTPFPTYSPRFLSEVIWSFPSGG